MSFDEGFRAYLKIPLDQTGIDDAVFFPDLLDFLIWEDYGLTDDGIEGYFQGLTPAQADLCIGHLRHEIDELNEDDLEYQSEEALTLLGRVIAEQERFDEFEEVARQMEVTGMAADHPPGRPGDEEAEEAPGDQGLRGGDDEGAAPGFLTEKYEKLKQGIGARTRGSRVGGPTAGSGPIVRRSPHPASTSVPFLMGWGRPQSSRRIVSCLHRTNPALR